jgi:hypothetical protein
MTFSISIKGNNYYMDSGGGLDSNTGTSASNAWQSFAAINSHSFNPGDTIFFKCGSIFNGNFQFFHSGIYGNPIVFTSYGTGTKPILNNPGQLYAMQLGSSWVIVENFQIQSTLEYGIQIINGAEHNIIRNCEFTNVGIGIGVSGKYNKITNNYIHDLHMVVNTLGGNDDYGATGVFLYNGNNEISYNTFINCKDTSYDYGQDGGVIDFYGNVDSCYIHHNYAEGCNGFFEIGGGTAISNTIAYNISVDNIYIGSIHLSGTFASIVNNLHLENNTIIETIDTGMVYTVLWFSAPANANTVYFQNNIVYINKFWYFCNDSAFTHRNNIYYFLDVDTQLGFTLSTGEIIADPLFENISAGNYHLTYNSPAKDAGLNLGYLLDFDNIPVPYGIQSDIGAYEYHGTSGITKIRANTSISVYPNPAKNYLTFETLQKSTIEILNLQGQTILQRQLQQGSTNIDISGLAKGLYILRLNSNNKTEVTRFVKE